MSDDVSPGKQTLPCSSLLQTPLSKAWVAWSEQPHQRQRRQGRALTGALHCTQLEGRVRGRNHNGSEGAGEGATAAKSGNP